MDLSAMPIATLGGAPGGAPFGLPGIPGGGENLVETIEVPDHTVGLGKSISFEVGLLQGRMQDFS